MSLKEAVRSWRHYPAIHAQTKDAGTMSAELETVGGKHRLNLTFVKEKDGKPYYTMVRKNLDGAAVEYFRDRGFLVGEVVA